MDGWTLSFVLLLPLTVCYGSEVTLVKTLGSEPDVTPLCTDDSMTIITLIMCRISRERSRGEQCQLLYEYKQGFEHGCGSRFKLITENKTVFLHLSSLTAEDSGNYTCQCSHLDGTYIVHLNITVEEEENSNHLTQPMNLQILLYVLLGVIFVTITSGVLLRFLYYSIVRQCSKSATPGASAHDSFSCEHHVDPENLYTSLQEPTADLYQSVSSVKQHVPWTNSAFNNQEVDRAETGPDDDLYENIGEAD
ncbi:uncharacterized protein LOC114848778 [Betta splendens]|uniref:Uncharacterized protein LOC114848778 n=1 Tax=Betta splendens TaxID=158456 RepID=A0A6P7LKT9_BETSP|nr:uncharacterized protein LOC114848778 [Betta splendens]